ncbi:MAG: pyridoxal-phosphate dependent enzyme [Anaerolineales bacterium]|nr:pyridoxal-phosphate dependent enzyme [Anaerolineales bacterium]
MIPYLWLEQAQERIAAHIRSTPLSYDKSLDIYIKWENHQATGSFKARGALNKVLTLQPWERDRGLVAASAGNHGQGLALAGKLFDAPVIIFVSEHAVPAKVEAMRTLGATIKLVPGGYREAEKAGLEYARSREVTWVSPYNDAQVIAGQATLGAETLKQLPPLAQSTWVVPAGGGGLIAGIGAAIKTDSPATSQHGECLLIGVQSEASAFLHAIYHSGNQEGIVEMPSLADGLAGPVELDSVTIPLVRTYVDDFILVSEQQIENAVRFAWRHYNECIEGAAAAALAAVISGKISFRPAVVIISGGNIQPEIHARILNSE